MLIHRTTVNYTQLNTNINEIAKQEKQFQKSLGSNISNPSNINYLNTSGVGPNSNLNNNHNPNNKLSTNSVTELISNPDYLPVQDFGKIPSLRKIDYSEEILSYIIIEEPPKPISFLDKQIIDLNSQFISDHDLFYLMRGVQNLNGLASLKILPYGYHEFKSLSANKLKILPLPLKDINYNEVPLTYKIKQIIQKLKREKLSEIKSFNPKAVENYSSLKIDVLFDNEDLAESFNIQNVITNDVYDFPHYIMTFTKSTYNFINVKEALEKALKTLDISNSTNKGLVLLLTTNYLFVAPLVRPYITYKNEMPIFPDPLFYAGVFTLPVIDSEWDETIERSNVEFDLFKILQVCSTPVSA